MADPVTPNYSFNLPTVGGDDNVWGDFLNANWSSIDTILWSVSGVASAALNQAAGDARYLRLTGGTVTGATSFPVIVSPLLSGTSGGAPPALINGPNPGDNSQTVPTTSWVNQAVSAAIGAIPTPPSPSNAAPAMNGTAAPGSSALYSRGDHVHPTDTTRAAASALGGYLALTGGTLTGPLVLAADPAAALGAATKQYVDAKPVAMNDNRIINGSFAVNQRGYASGAALVAAAYGHDRWKAGASGCTYTFTATQPDTTITITAGSLTQIIEAGMIEGGVYTLSWTGTAQARVYQGTPTGAYAASPIVTASLTAGTNTIVEFNAGTLVRAKLEIGSVATPFNRQSLAKSLADCQRYYQQLGGIVAGDISLQGYIAIAGLPLGSTIGIHAMRAAPTAARTGTWNATNVSSVNLLGGPSTVGIQAVAAAAGQVGTTTAVGTYLTLSAEL